MGSIPFCGISRLRSELSFASKMRFHQISLDTILFFVYRVGFEPTSPESQSEILTFGRPTACIF